MCPGCFAEWQREAYARSLRQWLVSERLSRSRPTMPANDVRRELRLDAYGLVPSRWRGLALRALVQL